jgi:hypothetical protein
MKPLTIQDLILDIAFRGGFLMAIALAFCWAFGLIGCAGCTPSPVGPGAQDAGGPPAVVVLDGGQFVLTDASTPCQAACARLQREGCPSLADCAVVYSDMERDRLVRMPNGQPLTCTAVVQAAKLSDVGLRCP